MKKPLDITITLLMPFLLSIIYVFGVHSNFSPTHAPILYAFLGIYLLVYSFYIRKIKIHQMTTLFSLIPIFFWGSKVKYISTIPSGSMGVLICGFAVALISSTQAFYYKKNSKNI